MLVRFELSPKYFLYLALYRSRIPSLTLIIKLDVFEGFRIIENPGMRRRSLVVKRARTTELGCVLYYTSLRDGSYFLGVHSLASDCELLVRCQPPLLPFIFLDPL